jgi:hypothetical protein
MARPSAAAKYHKAGNDAPDFRPPDCEIPLDQAASGDITGVMFFEEMDE